MSADPPVPESGRLRYYITDVEFQPPNTDPNCKISAKLFVDDELVCSLPSLDHTQPLRWSRLLICDASPESQIVLKLFKSAKGKQRSVIFPSFYVSEVNEEAGETTLDHPEHVWNVIINYLTPTVAERLFPDELDKSNRIKGSYDIHRPSETVKFLFKSALQFANTVTETLPEFTAKRSFVILMKTWELLEKQGEVDETIHNILRELTRIRDLVDVISQTSGSRLATALDRSKGPAKDILESLEDISIYIFNHLATNELGQTNGTYDIEAFSTRLEDLQKDFYASWSPSITQHTDSNNVVDNEPSSPTSHNIPATNGEPSASLQDSYETLNLLRPMDPSGYDPDRACMDGTREAVLNKVLTWTQNRDTPESFMWISGQAGIGKTAVATSLCQRLDSIGALAGSFFCKYEDPNASDPLRLINNLVHDFSMQSPAYAHEVAKVIRANRRLCNSHLGLRYEGLIKKPLERLGSMSLPRALVIVVDGLDECGDWVSRGKTLQKLHQMSQLVSWLKVIITARPVGDIQEYSRVNCSHESVIHLGEYDPASDIRAYIQGELGALARTEGWPDDGIKRLYTMSQGVFLWAALATEYIKNSILPSQPRLQTILDNSKSPLTDRFDALYRRVLETAMHPDGKRVKETYLRCIGAILAISDRESLSIPDLQYLLLVAGQIDQLTLERVLKSLSPLLLTADGKYAKFYHSSFRDYITDPSRSGRFAIQLDQYEAEPAACCLEVLQRDLRFNICELETSHLFNSEISDLNRRVDAHIGPTLKYACIHWIDHFIASPNQALVAALRVFFEGPQFMYWIEALSLLGSLDVAMTGLSKLGTLELTQFSNWEVVVASAKDTHRFVHSFFNIIAASTPHLYISALAFSPNTSITAQRMRPYFPNTIALPKDDNSTWHPCVNSILHPHPIQSLSISPDGLRLATGYPDGSLGIWDVRTGARIHSPLTGHSGSVTSVAFSPNGQYLATSSYDPTLRVWEPSNLDTSHVLAGHSGSVHIVTFSPDSAILASGSSDKFIRLWDTTTMKPLGRPYAGHSNRISTLSFSPDGARLASGSWDQTIRVWSVDLGGLQLAMNPLLVTGHSDLVTCVAFSPDGSRIASGSADKTIKIWSLRTNGGYESQKSPSKHSDSVTSVAFSPTGKLVVSSSSDGVIQLWDVLNSVTYSRPFGHSNSVSGVAFSPEESHVLSGSADRTTRMWEINATQGQNISAPPQTVTLAQTITYSSAILSIAISSNGTRIISGSADRTIQTWDAQTGTLIGSPYTGYSHGVSCVAFSPDDAYILSSSNDEGFVRCWDTSTHALTKTHNDGYIKPCTAFSPGGTFIAFSHAGNNVHLWDFAEWKMIGAALQGHSNHVLSLAFSPDGAQLASGSADHTIIIWDIKSHSRLRAPLTGHTARVRSVAFSSCGKLLVSGSDDKAVRIWHREEGKTIRTLTGHSACVTSVAFSPDGSCIASGSDDKSVRLWDSGTGEQIGEPFVGHSNIVTCVIFSPDGSHVISGSQDCTIRALRLSTPLSRPVAQSTREASGTFSWTSTSYELSPHPDHPGWVTHDQKSLVFWLPPHYERPDLFLPAPTLGPTADASLDYSKFVHGTAWTRVASDSIRSAGSA